MTMFQHRHVDAGGLDTHYLEAGEGSPLVLIHGGGAGADAEGNWANLIPMLAAHHRVLAPDMVGFGRSAKPDGDDYEYSQAGREAHIIAWLEALDIGPALLVGNSMGGLTALGVSVDRPDLVSGLVLMGSAGLPVPLSPQLRAIIEYDYSAAGMARIVDALTGPDFRAPDGMVDYRLNLSTEPDTRRAYDRIVAWQKANHGLEIPETRIASVTVPTLVMAGKDDGVVPVANAYRFLDLIPQSWGAILPRCGHWPMIEFPEIFTGLVRRFAAPR